jgi:hypothetical protein
LRTIAVIGMSSSRAAQTSARGQVLRLERLARQAVLAHERCRHCRRRGRLGAGEALDQARQAVGPAAADDPLEQSAVLGRDVQRRVARRHPRRRVGQAEQVAVGDALAPAVLDRLVGKLVHRLGRVPAADRAAEASAPAAEPLDERRELEQVGARAGHLRQRVERRRSRRLVAEAGRHRERKERRVVLRRAALPGDGDDLRHRTRAVLRDRRLDGLGVLAGQRPLGRVVRATLGAENEEAAQPRPALDGPDEAAGRVRSLARQREPLRRATRAVALQIHRVRTSFLCAGWKAAVVGRSRSVKN